ncbi:MAG: LruC domain-containing protein [Calditrichia bacterium]
MWRVIFTVMALLCLFLSNCSPINDSQGEDDIDDIDIPGEIDFTNTRSVQLRFNAIAPGNVPLGGKTCQVFLPSQLNDETLENPLFTGVSLANGVLIAETDIPTQLDSIMMYIDYGAPGNRGIVAISNLSAEFTLGQGTPKSYAGGAKNSDVNKYSYSPLSYMGSWGLSGVPDYLEPVIPILNFNMLDALNNTVSESEDVFTKSPQLFAGDPPRNLQITDTADVYISLIRTLTGKQNLLGFYTHTEADSIDDPTDIDSIDVVFPFLGSWSNWPYTGGERIHLGKFEPNTTLSFVEVSDGWDEPANLPSYPSGTARYSQSELNPASAYTMAMFKYEDPGNPVNPLIMAVMEDAAGYIDYSDHAFYFEVYPPSAIDTNGMAGPSDAPPDCDGDGVIDADDAYPCDATRAYNFYRSIRTLAFEADWPDLGDYDYNDVIIDYVIAGAANASNEVVNATYRFVLRAKGTDKQIGFGFQLPFSSSLVTTASAGALSTGTISLAGNGLEASQTKAVAIVFDDFANLMPPESGASTVNTEKGFRYVEQDTVTINMSFANGIPYTDAMSINPFLIIDGNRGHEIHIRNDAPTDLVDGSLFGTGNDASNPGSSIWYSSATNLSWGLEIPLYWEYPFEEVSISDTYFWFTSWLSSGGSTNQDWYESLSGYRDADNLYRSFGISKK